MQEQIILTPVPVDELLTAIGQLVRAEIKASQNENLEEKLLSPAEACQLLGGITKVTLWSWEKSNRIKKHRIGGRVFYKYGELMQSLETLKRYGRAAA